jgi:hypothetical protein
MGMIVMSKAVSKIQTIEKILEGLRGKSVCINIVGGISELKHIDNFDFWFNEDCKVLTLSDREDRNSVFLDENVIKDYYIDGFIKDNICLDLKYGYWLQVYEQ